MDKIFEKTCLGGINLKNRIIRSATHEGMADQSGRPSEKLEEIYVNLAKGGAGAIITGMAGIDIRGRALKNMLMINRDDLIEDFRKITEAVHAENTPIIMQLAHAGRQTDPDTTAGLTPVAPSPLRDKVHNDRKPKELSQEEIIEIRDNFIAAALRAQKAGFDGVQLHLAHGFLLSQFLSPYTNRRKDEWGKNTENRFRIVHEIIAGIKKKAEAFPIWVKLNGHDNRPGGMSIDEAARIAQLIEKAGGSAIEISCGVSEDRFGLNTVRTNSPPYDAILSAISAQKRLGRLSRWFISSYISFATRKNLETTNYNVRAAEQIKKNVSVPVFAVGGIKRLDDMKNLIDTDRIDAVSMARPFIKEPDIVNRFLSEDQTESNCTGCGQCLFRTMTRPLRCYQKGMDC